ncbi:cytochrome P450 71A9-like [Mercurialis annua]|uniref:cytochrome P450 71A9-like n=1 Tax=Mercurialis annua TaxID=3986 RepID=UPI0021604E2B|nr:cytochrome P450 71A9-like [Mercurialis annua]
MGVSFLVSSLSQIDQSMVIIIIIPFVFLASSLFFYFISNPLVRAKKLPPGPKRLPIIGNLYQLPNPIHKSLHHLAEKHGPLMYLQLGSVPTVIISSADMVRDIFRTHDTVFSGRPASYAAKKLCYNCSDIAFAPYGQQWKEMRKIASSELLSTNRVQSFKTVREEEVSRMIDSITNSSGPINLSELILLVSNRVVCRAAFGRNYESGISGGRGLDYLLGEAQEILGGFCIADFFPRMEWVCKFNGLEARAEKTFGQLDKFYDKILEEHLDPDRPEPEHEDLVDVLLRLQRDDSRNTSLSNDSIKGVLNDMFIAGTDTSAATIVWTMTELIRNPQVMKKVQEEVRELLKSKTKVEESDIPGLGYLKAVLKESFRIHPPTPLMVPRETIQDCRVGDYDIPAKTRVFINGSSIFMDPKNWENPSEFRPERFLNNSVDFSGQHFELTAFGVGRRGCPGMNFAVIVVELALANLLYHFDWGLPDGVAVDDIDMEEAFGITMHKKSHLYLVATPANNDV